MLPNKAFIVTTATIMATALLPSPVISQSRSTGFDFVTPSSIYQFPSGYRIAGSIQNVKNSQKEKFSRLAKRWKKETGVKSLIEGVILNGSYQKIIGMGDKALPFIFEDLNDSKSYWAHALTSITDEDPVPKGANMAEVRQAWLEWGMRRGYAAA